MHLLDRLPMSVAVVLALTLGLAPFLPEPHITEKLRMLAAGELVRPIDMVDLFWHGWTWVLLAAKLGRAGLRRR